MLFINGARFDLIDENKPFVGTKPIPPGRNLYPEGLTSAQIEAYVKAHPAEKDAIYSPYTVLRWNRSKLEAIPYHVEYKQWLEPAAKSLREAADLSDDKDFAQFLRMRADALLSDDYYPSDLKWLDLKNPKIDVIFAPYETYLDGVLGVKTSYEAAVLIRNEPESAKLALYQKYIPDLQDALPLAARGQAFQTRPADPDGSGGRAVPHRRYAARISGGGGQSAERSAHPRHQGNEENLLQELHGRARKLRGAAAGEISDAGGAGRRRFRAKDIWRRWCCTKSRMGWGRRIRA